MSGSDSVASHAIQTWLDKNALTELVAVLSSAVDRGDKELIASCYAEKSYDDHGAFKGSGREFADWVTTVIPLSGPVRIHHLLGQSVFDVHGDEAWGETFFIFHSVNDSDTQHGFGRYIDYFERIGSVWKLKYRRVVPDRTPEGDDIGTYCASSRDRADPVYDRSRWPTLT
ncbi:nuclear transport factor 2 family protein [Mycobacterium branderi]|uniref:SnoaL-like domain-containing protein n=1 Tax=Mycobacterium branderi TaxID=43348 RepID=A0A7I7WD30_9MYCO|nr:nuclear transport factor 2 family protein [Mycobacterium branderi]MCV7234656.1 nuclear transport factor 2 family protein [Mycobacterium branderi]ORA33190.1 hypothetical protein BST20_23365 [Mycobacterium branderi]BBZ15446.1 hypothetical protein MBRA_56410 [Mycobacterium branderi]